MVEGISNKVYRISAYISKDDKEKAIEYIKKSVRDYCENNPNKTISVRILFGGINRDWGETPLQKIFNYYRYVLGWDYEKAAKASAIDVGKLFKHVLVESKNIYKFDGKDSGNRYTLKFKLNEIIGISTEL